MLAKVNEKIGPYVYGIDADSLEQVLVGQLLERHKTIALAESCTGGLVAQKITSIPGSSGCFGYGIVSYLSLIHILTRVFCADSALDKPLLLQPG